MIGGRGFLELVMEDSTKEKINWIDISAPEGMLLWKLGMHARYPSTKLNVSSSAEMNTTSFPKTLMQWLGARP